MQNNNKILINARIIDPKSNYDQMGEIIIENDKIIDFGTNLQKKYNKNYKTIDCKNNVVCPGLIDLQVHFRDPGQLHKEDLVTGSKAASSGGITSVICQPNTNPVIDNLATIKYLEEKAKKEAFCNIYIYAAISKNMQGKELTDFAELAKSKLVVGFTDDGLPVMNAHLMRKALEKAKNVNKLIAQHAEDLDISAGGAINEGEISKKLNVKGIANISESIIVARDIELARLTGAKYHLLHCSTKEALFYVKQAKKDGLKVTAEVTPHHFSLTDEALLEYGSNAKMNPPLRSEQDRIALIEGLKDGTIDAIATDHAPHELESKNKPLEKASFGITGVETMLSISLELYHNKTLSLIELLQKITCNPAKIIDIARGEIKKGAIADLVVIDLNQEWQWQDVLSKSKNSPFLNRKFKGKAIKTFLAGKLVYQE